MLEVVPVDSGWALRISGAAEQSFGPCSTPEEPESWMHEWAAWRLWPLAQTRGPWGCLARTGGGWMTALARTGLPPVVEAHSAVQHAEEHAARHLVSPAVWTAGPDGLPDAVREIEVRFWVREGYRVLAAWATADLGALAREAYRQQQLGRGNFPVSELAARLGVSSATVSGAAAGRTWNPQISPAAGALAPRPRR
ncbi:hypothetical protein ACWEO1_21230 [Kitasatospora cineracea]